ncbi:IclR family transcriptional regulator C-terminal domain-containing protein [Georgenia sp. 10Sc9-8]|uniref:IclR family transcriptional regulator C-terminal domain-containing protein n=1 Tax=Georgenia halotolerans TaxID=3028317 RepID=A0ABT5TYA9_9MICO|nr:IclR family transcriptional regulator C-terminal domain-containing protein [Georgenia halotolerans]
MSESRLVRRTVGILKAVAAEPDGVGLSDLARATELPKATCLRVLSVLLDDGWVTLDPVSRRYRIGVGLMFVAGRLLEGDSVLTQVDAALAELSRASGETAGFDRLAGPDVTVLRQVAGTQLIAQVTRPVPRLQPVWLTSTGKALLAAMPGPVAEDLIRSWTEDLPELPTDRLLAETTATRQRGYAVTRDELEHGAASVAAVVPASQPVHALWVGGPTFRFTAERVAELGELLSTVARTLAPALARESGGVAAAATAPLTELVPPPQELIS